MMRSRFLARAVVLTLLAAATVGGCGSTSDSAPRPTSDSAPSPTSDRSSRPGRVLVADAPASAALAALPDGGLLAGALRGGPIAWVRADGSLVASGFRAPPVRTDGQRGLLSLAVDDRSRVYASWTPRGSERLVVGRLRDGAPPRIVWNGTRGEIQAIGGHLAFAPDGRLALGIGAHAAGRGPGAGPVGEMLLLDPNGPPNQSPLIISKGWINPFAFAFGRDGRLWIADNGDEGSGVPERLALGDAGGPVAVTDLPRIAPSGLAALPNGDLALCGFLSGTLDRYRRGLSGYWQRVGTIATRCRFGVVLLADGRLAYAEDRMIRVVRP